MQTIKKNTRMIFGYDGLIRLNNTRLTGHAPAFHEYRLMGKPDRPGNSGFPAEHYPHLDALNDVMEISISDIKGNIIYANELFCRHSKYSADELAGSPSNIVWHADNPSTMLVDLWNTIAAGKIWKGEIKNVAKDGTVFWVFETIIPITGADGCLQKCISMRHDITAQKEKEERQHEAHTKVDSALIDNIAHAKTMHRFFLDENGGVENLPNDAFLVYKAQKIISGDFYRLQLIRGKQLLVLGDSTGHGISASYISILLLNIMNRLVKISGSHPAKMIRLMNEQLRRITCPNGRTHLMETADIMACCIDTKQMKLEYASANIRGFIVRNGETLMLERDKCSVGEKKGKEFNITSQVMKLEKGDCLYIFSDGLIDQFGGPLNKRIGLRRVVSAIEKLYFLPMKSQKAAIEKMLADWQDENEQTDDITLLGIRI
jgi:PAS domain S-box-containing protein